MPGGPPNIVFIITDQQRYDTIAELGYSHVQTPHLDRLVREGVSFDRCYVTAASCADEVHNLWDVPTAAGEKEKMLAVLREWRIRSQYETADWSADWR